MIATWCRATIEDVASEAGVSVATVDRVLNGRAAVRPQTAERVEKAIRRLNYQPDRLAARLARAREYRFCFVLPEGTNAFMIALGDAVREEALRMAREKVVIDLRHTDVFDADTLAATLDAIGTIYDGVAVVALDHPRVREAINALADRGVTRGDARLRRAEFQARALCRHRQFGGGPHRGNADGALSLRAEGQGGPDRRLAVAARSHRAPVRLRAGDGA